MHDWTFSTVFLNGVPNEDVKAWVFNAEFSPFSSSVSAELRKLGAVSELSISNEFSRASYFCVLKLKLADCVLNRCLSTRKKNHHTEAFKFYNKFFWADHIHNLISIFSLVTFAFVDAVEEPVAAKLQSRVKQEWRTRKKRMWMKYKDWSIYLHRLLLVRLVFPLPTFSSLLAFNNDLLSLSTSSCTQSNQRKPI